MSNKLRYVSDRTSDLNTHIRQNTFFFKIRWLIYIDPNSCETVDTMQVTYRSK